MRMVESSEAGTDEDTDGANPWWRTVDDHRKDADRIDAVWERDDDQEYTYTVLIDSSANQIVIWSISIDIGIIIWIEL